MPALIFDCDGVLADTERDGHLPAFNATFKHFDLPVCWSDEEYAQKLTIGGGKERLKSLLTSEFIGEAHLPTDPEGLSDSVASWHAYKTGVYTDLVADGVMPGRPGIARIVTAAHQAGWTLAVASTSHEDSVRAVLEYSPATSWPRRSPHPTSTYSPCTNLPSQSMTQSSWKTVRTDYVRPSPRSCAPW